ncbi:putative transcription factor B3-Domain family [Helianthus anomalus]
MYNMTLLMKVVPVEFVNKKWGQDWQHMNIEVHHEDGRHWMVRLRHMDSLPVLTDGWRAVVNHLDLAKNTWLLFKSIGDKKLEVYPFINDVCGQTYITMNNYTKLGLTVSVLFVKTWLVTHKLLIIFYTILY